MKAIRIILMAAVAGVVVVACGTAGQAIIAAPQSTPTSTPAATPTFTPAPARTATEVPVTATVIVTATAAAPAVTAVPPVTVTAPPPVIYTVTAEPPPVIVVPDPTTVYSTDYYVGHYSVAALPDGLYCRDLKAMGYSFSDAITYWNYRGQPSRMDLDLDGIPCETVY